MQLTEKQKYAIILFHEEGMKQREIGEKLKINQSTVSRLLKKYDLQGSIEHLNTNGRKTVITEPIKKVIEQNLRINPKTSLRKLSASVEKKLSVNICYNTVKNFLNNQNLYAFKPRSKPLLTARHIKLRFEASQNFLFMSEEEVKSIIFSDESKFNLFYSDGKVSVWREPGTGLEPKNLACTVKHGGASVMVWGCFSYHGVGKLVFIDGIMDAAKYVDILSRNLCSSANSMGLSEFIFQQDNDPKHTAKLTKRYFESKNMNILEWPPQSPDMNPIENLWGDIKAVISEKMPKNIRELKELISAEWQQITVERCQKLAMSFKKRSLELYRAKGGHINY